MAMSHCRTEGAKALQYMALRSSQDRLEGQAGRCVIRSHYTDEAEERRMKRIGRPISITLTPVMLAKLKRLTTPGEPFTATIRAVIAAGLKALGH